MRFVGGGWGEEEKAKIYTLFFSQLIILEELKGFSRIRTLIFVNTFPVHFA
jgi:hypothetical protein